MRHRGEAEWILGTQLQSGQLQIRCYLPGMGQMLMRLLRLIIKVVDVPPLMLSRWFPPYYR
jgi:hypothetical protein